MPRRVLLAFAVVVAVFVLRAPSLRVDILNEDEALYATTAASMAEGAPPYRAGVESKPPGIFYLYEAGFAVVGRYHMRALHALTMLWVLATALLVGSIARRAVPGARDGTALTASLLYAAFTIVQEPAVLATQCELLYSLPLAAAAWLMIRAVDATRPRTWMMIVAGVLCAAATLIKPTAISLPVAGSAWLVVRGRLFAGPARLRADLLRALALWAGFALTWLAAAAYFDHLGVWHDLVYWAFRWTLGTYLPTGTAHSPWLVRFLAGFASWLALTAVLWLLAGLGLRRAARHRAEPAAQVLALITAWTLAATALTFLGGRFYDHYFPAVIPPLAVLAAVGWEACRARAGWRRVVAIGVGVPVLACWLGAWQFATTMRWLGDERHPVDQITAYVRSHTDPRDRVFVWGYFPLIYVGADRLAASRYVGCHYLTGYAAIGLDQDLAPEVEDRLGVPDGFPTLIADLEATRPALLIDTAPAGIHHWGRYPLARYPSLAAYVAAHYVLETTVQDAPIYRRRAP